MKKLKLSIKKAKKISIVDYLLANGFKEQKISAEKYWYQSPFREEKDASFKVDTNKNTWYDFGEGKGGDIIDLVRRLKNLNSVPEALTHLTDSFRYVTIQEAKPTQIEEDSRIKIVSEKPLAHLALIRYLKQRKISLEIAKQYLKEVRYELRGKEFFALGFKNDSGGYEIRNERFKAGSSPKDATLIKNNSDRLQVFEGFFDFLTYLTIQQKSEGLKTDYLVLNSVTSFDKSMNKMEAYKSVHLFLDNDNTGNQYTVKALKNDPLKFKDERKLYEGYKDLNEWSVGIGKGLKQKHSLRP